MSDTALMSKVADYIEKTQPLLDKAAEQQSSFVKRATQAAGVLAHRGVIHRDSVNEFVDKVAEDPTRVWDFIEKLARAANAETMGQAVSEKGASGSPVDPFERHFFGRGQTPSGMVEIE